MRFKTICHNNKHPGDRSILAFWVDIDIHEVKVGQEYDVYKDEEGGHHIIYGDKGRLELNTYSFERYFYTHQQIRDIKLNSIGIHE